MHDCCFLLKMHQPVDITPSDDLAPPSMDDMRDFAHSPQDAASELAATAGQSLEDFLSQETSEPVQATIQDPFRQVCF